MLSQISTLNAAKEKKELALGYALWCLSLVGICGVQRIYLGQVGLGIVFLFTFGFCGIAQLLDLLLLPDAVKEANQRLELAGSGAVSATTPSQPIRTPKSPHASSSSFKLADNDELDELLRQAEKSVSRTENLTKED